MKFAKKHETTILLAANLLLLVLLMFYGCMASIVLRPAASAEACADLWAATAAMGPTQANIWDVKELVAK